MMKMLLLKIGRPEHPETYYMLRIPTQNPEPLAQAQRVAEALQPYLCEGVTIGMGTGPNIEFLQPMEHAKMVEIMLAQSWKDKYGDQSLAIADEVHMAGRIREDIDRFRAVATTHAGALLAAGFGIPDGTVAICQRCMGTKTSWGSCKDEKCPLQVNA